MNINYEDLIAKYSDVMPYIIRCSDAFSVITNMEKPYSKEPFHFEHREIMRAFEPYILDYVAGIRKWPGTETKAKHKAMVMYKLCRETRQAFQDLPNVLLPIQNNLPEDIAFYRNGNAWFATISHEKIAFMNDPTKDDCAFLQRQGVRFCNPSLD